MGRIQYGIRFSGGLAYLVEALDTAIIGSFLPCLKVGFALTDGDIGFISGAAQIGMIVAAALAGMLGDRLGRKNRVLCALLRIFAGS